MRIVGLRPADSAAEHGLVAIFDAEVAPGVRISRINLKRNQHGEFRVFGPRIGSGAVAFFTPEVLIELTALAKAALKGATRHESAR